MDEVINVVNAKQAKKAGAEKNRRKEQDCQMMRRVAAIAALGGVTLAAAWLPILAFPCAWILFTAAVVVADRHIRRK